MKKILLFALFAFSARVSFASDAFKLIHTSELEMLMKTEKNSVHIYDANSEETRKSEGLIPSAEVLSSSSRYDIATLPKDKTSTLVFYCQNAECMASHGAAQLATKAGYKNVYVMSDGIQGWKKAGKPTQKYDKKG